MKHLKNLKLIIATPCFGGLCNAQYTRSLIDLVLMAKSLGVKINILFNWNSSLITKGRNDLANNFLFNTDADYFMFIDSDIEFQAMDVIRLLGHQELVVGGTYAKKELQWNLIKDFYLSNMAGRYDDEVLQTTNKYALSISDDKSVINDKGLIEVDRLPTGFLMIKREAFDLLKPYCPKYKLDNNVVKGTDTQIGYAYFETYINEELEYISEDYGFCDRWRKTGGKVYVDPALEINHIGNINYKGCMLTKIKNWNNGKTK
tara:strand:- start:4755 stop:5534 length:780 start_codon:yes stop_codon:yes gene_type:complete